MKIVTHCDPPPIPLRDMDWTAVDDDTYDGSPGQPIGRGATEKEAIDDLCEQLDICPPGCGACEMERSGNTSTLAQEK